MESNYGLTASLIRLTPSKHVRTDETELLAIQGTAREGRRSIHVARHVTEKLKERWVKTELFDIAEKDIPFLKHCKYTNGDEHPEDAEEFGRKVEAAEGLLIVTP